MKNLLVTMMVFSFSSLFFGQAFAEPTHWVTVDSKILEKVSPIHKNLLVQKEADGISLVQLKESEIEKLSDVIHHELHRCGGFITHDTQEEAEQALRPSGDRAFGMKGIFNLYTISQQTDVAPMVSQVQASSIEETIRKMSSFQNRYYKAATGLESQDYVLNLWKKLAQGRSDIKVEYYKHTDWPQPSVIMTIEGSEYPQEIVVVGGHADSISGGFFGREKAHAPGADDNASGIATITEAARILIANNYRPKRTIQFMAYAAEEVGLLGSKDIANSYKTQRKSVIGKIQFDMTLRKGTADKDIVLMSDFTNAAQNEFLGKLIDEYVKVPWGYSRCGYGCSDHASWTNAGFPASIPFEAEMKDSNKAIHTNRDTIETAGGDARHSAKFAKLAIAYMVELAH